MKFSLLIAAIAISYTAKAEIQDPCAPVFMACSAQGFEKDDNAPAGKKIWLDCASQLLINKKSVAKVNIDPKGSDVAYCNKYREAKAKFDADFVKNNKKN